MPPHCMRTIVFILQKSSVLMILKQYDHQQVSTGPRLWEDYLQGQKAVFITMAVSQFSDVVDHYNNHLGTGLSPTQKLDLIEYLKSL